VPGHAAVPPDGGRGATPAQGLAALRHGTRRLPPEAHDGGGAGRRLCLVLRAAVLAPLDLAETAGGLACCGALPGDVVPIQAFEPALASAHPPSADGAGLAPARRVDAPTAPALPPEAGVPCVLQNPGEGPVNDLRGGLNGSRYGERVMRQGAGATNRPRLN